ncbi:hypothetical protein ACFOU2_07580 [Bacillus songklensis]|uniref:Uncharacterized protein n=1 Tax=Bacillus songklensis TaxID=1069116 RepID=A0ABV8B1G6_9BACI
MGEKIFLLFLIVQLHEPAPTVISLLPTEAKSASLSGVPMPYGEEPWMAKVTALLTGRERF